MERIQVLSSGSASNGLSLPWLMQNTLMPLARSAARTSLNFSFGRSIATWFIEAMAVIAPSLTTFRCCDATPGAFAGAPSNVM